jgi:hypothetical protein
MRARRRRPDGRRAGGQPVPCRAPRAGSVLRAIRVAVLLLHLLPLALPLTAGARSPGGAADGPAGILAARPRDVDGGPAAAALRSVRGSRPVLALAHPRVPSLTGPEPGGRPDAREPRPAALAVSPRLDPPRGPPPA